MVSKRFGLGPSSVEKTRSLNPVVPKNDSHHPKQLGPSENQDKFPLVSKTFKNTITTWRVSQITELAGRKGQTSAE